MEETGKSGVPDSHFHDPSVSKWLGYYGLTREQFSNESDALTGVFNAARKRGTGASEIFGLRLQRHSFDFFIQQLGILYSELPSDKERIQAVFGNTLFIHLFRKDKLEQAISFVKATQTGLSHKAIDGTELERISPPQDPFYDENAISQQLKSATKYDEEWYSWFAEEKIMPLFLTYDELSLAPHKALGRILNYLGVEYSPVSEIQSPVAKMADGESKMWAGRYRAEKGGAR